MVESLAPHKERNGRQLTQVSMAQVLSNLRFVVCFHARGGWATFKFSKDCLKGNPPVLTTPVFAVLIRYRIQHTQLWGSSPCLGQPPLWVPSVFATQKAAQLPTEELRCEPPAALSSSGGHSAYGEKPGGWGSLSTHARVLEPDQTFIEHI